MGVLEPLVDGTDPRARAINERVLASKTIGGFLLSVADFLILSRKLDIEINLWHWIGLFLALIVYDFILFLMNYTL